MDPWWSQQAAGLVGGLAGGAIGVLGGALGLTAGLLAPKGRGKRAVLALCASMFGLGAVSLVVGVIAALIGQPYHVFYPLILIGLVGTLVSGINTPVILNRYKQAQARKLSAEEVRRS